VLKAAAPPHVPLCPPLTLTQETVTALAGTVAHELNVAGALTVTLHVRAVAPPVVFHDTCAFAEPLTVLFVSGSFAVKVMADGVTAAFETLVAIGFSRIAAGADPAGARPAEVRRIADTSSDGVIDSGQVGLGCADRERRGCRIGPRLVSRIVRQAPRNGARVRS